MIPLEDHPKKHLPREIMCIIVSCAGYFLLAFLSTWMGAFDSQVSPYWPASGFALATLIAMSRTCIVGTLIAAFLTHVYLVEGTTLATSAIAAIGTATYLFLLAELLERFTAFNKKGQQIVDTLRFVGFSAGAAALGAALGAFTLWMSSLQGAPVAFDRTLSIATVWWLGDTIGILSVTPLFLAWKNHGLKPSADGRLAQRVIVVSLVLVAGVISFFNLPDSLELSYLIAVGIIVTMGFSALRFGPRTNTTLAAILVLISSIGTALGKSAIAPSEAIATVTSLWVLAGFQLAILITTLTVSASEDAFRKINKDLKTRHEVLKAVSEISQRFVEVKSWEDAAQELVDTFGPTLGVSRIYIFENVHIDGEHYARQRFEWAAEGIDAQINNPDLALAPWDMPGVSTMRESLSRGRPYIADVSDFDSEGRELMEAQGIVSLYVLPIIVDGTWWGFVGCDDCQGGVEWNEAIRDAMNAISGVLGSSISRVGAIEALEERERRYRALAEHAEDIVAILSPKGEIKYLSDSAIRYLGNDKAAINHNTSINSFELIHPEDQASLWDSFIHCLGAEGRVVPIQKFRLRHTAGVWQWHEGVIQNLSHDPIIGGVVANFRNVEERIRKTEELRLREERYRAISENSLDLVKIFDANNKISYFSPQSMEVLGLQADSLVGTDAFNLIHPEDVSAYQSVTASAQANPGVPLPFPPLRIPSRDRNGWMWVEGTLTNLLHEDAVQGMVCNFRDVSERVLEHGKIVEGENRLRTFMRVSQDAIWYFELDQPIPTDRVIEEQVGALWGARVKECNWAFAKDYGVDDAKSLIGVRYSDLKGFQRDRQLVNSLFNDFVRNNYVADSVETNEIVNDGSERSFIKSARGVVEDGRLIGYWGTSVDITERNKHLRAEREAQERIRTFVSQASDGIGYYHYDQPIDLSKPKEVNQLALRNCTLMEANDAFAQILMRQQASEVIGSRPWDNEFENSTTQLIDATIDAKFELLGYEVSGTMPDGTPRHVLTNITGVREGEFIVGAWVTMKDITSLRFRDLRFQKMAENAFDGILVLGEDGIITEIFGATEKITAYAADELIGVELHSLVAEEERGEARTIFEQVLANPDRPIESQRRLVARDGTIRHWRIIYTNRLNNPYIKGIVSNFRDISDEVDAQTKMQHTQKLESLGVLAGGIAHDFNNLLVSIQGNADIALSKTPPSHAIAKNLEGVRIASQRAADLCTQMLAYSGKGHFVIKPLSLSELVNDMAGLLDVSLRKKAALSLDLPEDIPAIEGDATQIRQVVMNLLTNAAEAVEEKFGKVDISLRFDARTEAEIASLTMNDGLSAGNYVMLEVKDDGEGMSAETLKRLFEPFYTTKFSGRGLGMSAVLGILRGHGAGVDIKSELGKGTTITLYFSPSSQSPARSTPESGVFEAKVTTSTASVLVVDDEASIREIAFEMLEMLGYQPTCVGSGQEAIEAYRDNGGYDLVLLDLTMPEMDGAETLDKLREQDPNVKALISSGYSESIVVENFGATKGTVFVAKPYTLERLETQLRKALR